MFIRIVKLSQIRQNVQWVTCDPKGKGKLRPYVADIPKNVWVRDLSQQCGTQINIPGILGKRNKEIGGNKVDSKRRN